ncbi:oligosaccharide flippase family protein [Pseudoduganella sp. FT55W]|uniref:Oligosaccharide flippase family protein n=1 Tax=Duganella rivi TaxID=2666083 RepID=A0A7X4K9L0_9BURK|nr:oligosaccharide flippase family protein [Duganella rivi]MYM65304.1 oligosaccharide flippase family protein [Duganella rivi]
MFSKKILAAASVFSKLISGSGVFIVTGYFISPESLGRLAVFVAYSTLMCLVTDYGLQNPALREISIDNNKAASIFNKYTLFRIFLFLPVFALTLGVFLATGTLHTTDLVFFSCLAVASLFSSHGDFAQIYFRGIGKYATEAWISIISGVLHLVLVGLVAYEFKEVEYIGMAILGSKLFYLAASVIAAKRYDRVFSWSLQDVRDTAASFFSDLKRLKYYAGDSVVTASFAQLDIIFVSHFFGMHFSGVYQVGAKVTQISLAVVQVFSATYIPSISNNLHGKQRNEAEASRNLRSATIELFIVGVVFALGMVFILPYILHAVFGTKYEEGNILFVGFGMAVIARCLAAPFGIALIALDKPKVRLIGQLIVSGTYSLLAVLLFPTFGFAAASTVMAISLWTALAFYSSCTYRASPSLMKNAFLPHRS